MPVLASLLRGLRGRLEVYMSGIRVETLFVYLYGNMSVCVYLRLYIHHIQLFITEYSYVHFGDSSKKLCFFLVV